MSDRGEPAPAQGGTCPLASGGGSNTPQSTGDRLLVVLGWRVGELGESPLFPVRQTARQRVGQEYRDRVDRRDQHERREEQPVEPEQRRTDDVRDHQQPGVGAVAAEPRTDDDVRDEIEEDRAHDEQGRDRKSSPG